MPRPFNQQSFAGWTDSVRGIGVDISFIDVLESGVHCDLPGLVERLWRRARLVLQFEIGMKRGEVQRHMRSKMLQNPTTQSSRFVRIIIERGDHQVCNLE